MAESTFVKPEFPRVTLSNGLRVGNFSSPHPFKFTDGSELPACSQEHAKRGALKEIEYDHHAGIGSSVDIKIRWELNDEVRTLLHCANAEDDIDVFLVPLPVMTAMKAGGMAIGKCRVIRCADRVSRAIYIDRFCV